MAMMVLDSSYNQVCKSFLKRSGIFATILPQYEVEEIFQIIKNYWHKNVNRFFFFVFFSILDRALLCYFHNIQASTFSSTYR